MLTRRVQVAGALTLLLSVSCAVGFGPGVAGAAGGRGPVTITSNADFGKCGCVTSGNGTAASPYVIGPYQIASPSSAASGGYAVKVSGITSTSFEITGISIGYNDTTPSHPVIWLSGDSGTASAPILISNIDANNDGTGVRIDNSSYVSLNDLNINKMNGGGLVLNGASYISLSNSKLKATSDRQLPSTHAADGLYAVNSSNLSIGGVAACPKSQVCNSFDYDSGWGIYLQNVSNSLVDYATANADDTGSIVLDNSSGVTVENTTAEAGGPICVTLNGAKVPTGYALDSTDLQGGLFLVNGSSNDSILNDSFAANLGISMGSGGNGFYFNPCLNADTPFPALDSPPGSFVEGVMGSGNVFSGTCYDTSNIPGLPPSNHCK